jgi:hypothetical protein
MEIIIPLPTNISANTYKELKGYLKQFELAIHHAQKAVENAEETGIELSEDSFVNFEHPQLRNIEIKNFAEDYHDELQSVELRINLQ